MPFDAACVTRALRSMPADRLASVHPHDFQRHPAPVILPGAMLREMIANERARRGLVHIGSNA